MATTSLLEFHNKRADFLGFGMDIKLDIKQRPLIKFRISYSNNSCNVRCEGGIEIITGDLTPFVDELYGQLSGNGYVVEACDEPFCEDCAYIYLNKKDIQKEYPRLKVYVHPSEMAGWAPSLHVKKLQKIAEENSLISNVNLVFSQKVYDISNTEYLDILKKAEPQIREWLSKYQKHYGRRRGNPGETFNETFGIRRLSVLHLGSHDYVSANFVNSLR